MIFKSKKVEESEPLTEHDKEYLKMDFKKIHDIM